MELNLIKYLVRLSAISEEIEETNPDASNLIDENVGEIADDLGTDEPINELDPTLYPRVQTPEIQFDEFSPEHSDPETHAKGIVDEILSSPEFQQDIEIIKQSPNKEQVIDRFLRSHPDLF